MTAGNTGVPATVEKSYPTNPSSLSTLIKVVVLAAIFIWAFHRDLFIISKATYNTQNVFLIAFPVTVCALLSLRWQILRQSCSTSSWWGLIVVIAGLAWYALTTWPFDYEFLRLMALPIILAGCIQVAGGTRLLKHCLPFVFLAMICVPLGPRKYADLIVRPETITLQATRAALGVFPDVNVILRGSDMVYTRNGAHGVIALGETNRGMDLLDAYALIGVFVIFAKVRPFWQIVVTGAAAFPLILLANFIRIFMRGLLTIYGHFAPISDIPRTAAAVGSILATFALFAGLCFVLSSLVVEENESSLKDEVADG